MSDTQSYKTVTFSPGELASIQFALDVKIAAYEARKFDGTFTETTQQLLDVALTARTKVEAAL